MRKDVHEHHYPSALHGTDWPTLPPDKLKPSLYYVGEAAPAEHARAMLGDSAVTLLGIAAPAGVQ